VVIRKNMGSNGWALAVAGLGSCLVIAAACAGGDTPPRDAALEEKIRTTYDPDYKTGAAGSVSMGTGGSSSGTGGSSSGTGGSASGTGGSASGGASGSGTAGSGTAGSGTSGSGSTGAVCDAPTKVLQYYCGLGSGCHGPGAALGDFGVDEAAALALVDKPTKNAACGKYIDSANPEQSAVLLKLGDKPPCGAQMPFGGNPVSPEDVDCLTSWLDSL
jgi:hypothetical protein